MHIVLLIPFSSNVIQVLLTIAYRMISHVGRCMGCSMTPISLGMNLTECRIFKMSIEISLLTARTSMPDVSPAMYVEFHHIYDTPTPPHTSDLQNTASILTHTPIHPTHKLNTHFTQITPPTHTTHTHTQHTHTHNTHVLHIHAHLDLYRTLCSPKLPVTLVLYFSLTIHSPYPQTSTCNYVHSLSSHQS